LNEPSGEWDTLYCWDVTSEAKKKGNIGGMGSGKAEKEKKKSCVRKGEVSSKSNN